MHAPVGVLACADRDPHHARSSEPGAAGDVGPDGLVGGRPVAGGSGAELQPLPLATCT